MSSLTTSIGMIQVVNELQIGSSDKYWDTDGCWILMMIQTPLEGSLDIAT